MSRKENMLMGRQMKTIRYVAALLMILTGVMHILPIFKSPRDSTAILMLAFGIIYLAIGVLLALNLKFAPILGIVFPLIGLGTPVFVAAPRNLSPIMFGILGGIDVVVLVCCILLVFNKKSVAPQAQFRPDK